jgi:hypothetical protein
MGIAVDFLQTAMSGRAFKLPHFTVKRRLASPSIGCR